jgi:hypothetical protein
VKTCTRSAKRAGASGEEPEKPVSVSVSVLDDAGTRGVQGALGTHMARQRVLGWCSVQ